MSGPRAPLQALRRLCKPILLVAVVLACFIAPYEAANASPPEGGFGSPPPSSSQCDANGPKLDCGWNGIEDWKCASKGCCYDDKGPFTVGTDNTKVAQPVCFFPNGAASNYDLNGSFKAAANGNGLQGSLKQNGTGTMAMLGDDIQELSIQVERVSPDILRCKIGAPGRWEVPKKVFLASNITGSNSPANYLFNYSTSPFTFAVARSDSNGEALFNTVGQRFVFKDQYIEISTSVPAEAALFGLGERTSSTGLELQRNGVPLALWNRDHQAALPDQNVYGSHPILMDVRPGGKAHGIALINSNAMDVVLTQNRVQWRVTGGVLDFYFLMGPTPNAVMEQLTTIIGRPVMPPYWSMGLMQSKYGYGSAEFYGQILNGYGNASIPMETFVSDSQYMDHDQDFTLGYQFPLAQMKAFGERIRAQKQRWVLILDPPIHIKKGYYPYDSGIKNNVFLQDITGKPYVGQMWPGATHWPDFMNPATWTWWMEQIQGVYKDLEFDGLWIDMNEPSNYCTGDVCWNDDTVPARNDFVCMIGCVSGRDAVLALGGNQTLAKALNASYFNPPYQINNGDNRYNASYKTVAVTAMHYDGTLEYNAHNLYGMYETLATANALQKLRNKRQFILTRSTFLGSGAYAAHWTGDTNSRWTDMRWSITTILNNGIAGISFSGADICGFMEKATEELCARWIAVGAFYPYARDHHSDGWQELFRWEQVAEVSRKVLAARYRLMPYLYTAFFDSHTYGCPVARPLFFGWASDNTTRGINEQWMMGDALLVSPIMYASSTHARVYFPAGTWYDFYSGRATTSGNGTWGDVYAGVTDNVPLHILGGNIIPVALGQQFMLTEDVRNASLALIVALPAENSTSSADRCGGRCGGAPQPGVQNACGHMYLDQGEEMNLERSLNNYLTMASQVVRQSDGTYKGFLSVSFNGTPGGSQGASCGSGNDSWSWPVIDEISVLGVGAVNGDTITVQSISQSGSSPGTVQTASVGDNTGVTNLSTGKATYDPAIQKLTIPGINFNLSCPTGLRVSWTSARPTAQAQQPAQAVGQGDAALVGTPLKDPSSPANSVVPPPRAPTQGSPPSNFGSSPPSSGGSSSPSSSGGSSSGGSSSPSSSGGSSSPSYSLSSGSSYSPSSPSSYSSPSSPYSPSSGGSKSYSPSSSSGGSSSGSSSGSYSSPGSQASSG